MNEEQQAALRSFYRFANAKGLAELLECEAHLDQAKSLYESIWTPELQNHWRSAKSRLGRMRNRMAIAESRQGRPDVPAAPPLIDAQGFKVRTDAVPLNVGVSMAVVEKRFVGSDHVVLDEVILIIDGIELSLPPETYQHPTIARALKALSRAHYVQSLPSQSEHAKTAPFRMRAA